MANDRKQIYLAFRNGINKLTGKQKLIDAYEDAMGVLSAKSDSLRNETEKKKLIKQLEQISEEKWSETKTGFSISGFNPYLIKTPKSKIKSKIDMLYKLMEDYKVK